MSISSLDISVGDAFTIHMGDVTLTPGQATMASVTGATVTTNLLSGFQTISLGAFTLTQQGFSLSNLSFTPAGSAITIGSFASISSPVFNVDSFILSGSTVTSSITFSGSLTIFPGNSNVTSSVTNLQAQFAFSSVSGSGALTLTADSFSLTVDKQLTISASGLTFTPDQTTILHVDTASVTLAQLNGLTGTISGLDIQNNGFTIASATVSVTNVNFNLGGVVAFSTTPSVTLTNISYTIGGSLGGTVTLNPTTVTLSVGPANASGTFSGDYNIKTGTLNGELDSFSLNLDGFVSITGTSSLVVLYQPATDGSATFYMGGQGLTLLMGSGSGVNSVGVVVSNASFALGVFKAATVAGGAITYAFDASGGISIVGLPANSVTFSAANVEVRANNTGGAIDQFVSVDNLPADAVHLFFTGNEQSLIASGLQLTIGSLVTITGNFGFQTFTDPNTSLTDVIIGASDVTAILGTTSTNLTITGASLGLLILPSATNTYAVVASGGSDTLNGVPGLSVSASGLTVKVNTTGIDPTTITGLPPSLTTPDGTLLLDFGGLGSGNIIAVEGSITLNIAGFISLKGDFGFQTFTDSNSVQDIIVVAENVNAMVGSASSVNLSIIGASLELVIVPGVSGGYSLIANGGVDTLNGVPDLTLSASDLSVRINTLGIDPTTLGLPSSIPTVDGVVVPDFSSVGALNIKNILVDLTLNVTNFSHAARLVRLPGLC